MFFLKSKLLNCTRGKRSLGGVVVEYSILHNGVIDHGQKFLNPSKCMNNPGGMVPIHGRDDEMIFIKKVMCK